MKRYIRLVAAAGLFSGQLMAATSPTPAENTKTSPATVTLKKDSSGKKSRASLSAWLTKMKKKVAQSQAKHNKLIAVAAVRGDESQDAPPLYWRGKKSLGTTSVEELNSFNTALSLAEQGDTVAAQSHLEKFLQSYPKSPMADDAQTTLNILKDGE